MGRKIDNVYAKQREVVCVEAYRTPYGKSNGALVEYDAAQLGALAIKAVIRRTEKWPQAM